MNMNITTTTSTEMDSFRLGHHLRIAYEQYVDNAKVMREAGMERVAEEFDRLAQQAQDWANIFQHEDILKVIADANRLWVVHHNPYGDED